MDTLAVIILGVIALLLLLAIGGAAMMRRRAREGESVWRREIEFANRDLAEAHAADNGWEPARVAEAARTSFSAQRPGVEIVSLHLVQVIDPPGTDDDKALFVVETAEGEHHMTLGRHGDHWHFESIA